MNTTDRIPPSVTAVVATHGRGELLRQLRLAGAFGAKQGYLHAARRFQLSQPGTHSARNSTYSAAVSHRPL